MAAIPRAVRPAARHELDALVAGERPELLYWVRRYGTRGTSLVRQPESIWDHPFTDFLVREDGSCYGAAPLWTVDESPSDLSVEFEISADGTVLLTNVHVM